MEGDRLRLLVLTPEFAGSGGGIMTFYQQILPVLARNGIDVRVIEGSALNAATAAAPIVVGGVRVERLERSRLAAYWDQFGAFAAQPGLRRHLAGAWAMWEQSSFGADADIVEACDWGCLFIPPAVEADRPLVVQCHGSIGQVAMHDPIVGEETRDMLEQLLERSVMARANKVQTYSRANAEFWQQEACREVDMISPAFLSAMLPDQPIANHGLVVGRLQQWKGPQVVCNALRLVGGKSLRIQWLGRDMPWGSGQTSSSSHLARAFPDIWGTQLIHGPPVARDEVDRLQSRALFNVVPSTWDVFNFTAIEAMASGRPTIVSTGAGASEIIEDGINGFLFPAGDASALAAAIDRVLCIPPKQLAELGALARETVRRCFDPDRIAVQRIAAYRAAMDSFKKTKPTPIGGWLGRVCRPAAQADEGSMAFLDQHPLRDILRYSMGRLSRRLGLQ